MRSQTKQAIRSTVKRGGTVALGALLVLGTGTWMAGAQEDSAGTHQQEASFLKKASEGGFAEVKLGHLAEERAKDPEVKAFGRRMVHDHSMLDAKMKPVAERFGVAPPTELSGADQVTYDKLASLSGSDFDKEYISDMVRDHTKDLSDFKQEESEATDPQLKADVTSAAEVIAHHLALAQHLAGKLGVDASGDATTGR